MAKGTSSISDFPVAPRRSRGNVPNSMSQPAIDNEAENLVASDHPDQVAIEEAPAKVPDVQVPQRSSNSAITGGSPGESDEQIVRA